MPATYRRNALERIGIVINAYKPQTPQNLDLAAKHERLNGYLNVHLVSQDWIVWQQLPHDEQAFFIDTLAVKQAELMSSQAFKRLFCHYKRAGLEGIKRLDQAQGESYFDQ